MVISPDGNFLAVGDLSASSANKVYVWKLDGSISGVFLTDSGAPAFASTKVFHS